MRLPNQEVRSVDNAGRSSETAFKFNKAVQRFMHQAGKSIATGKLLIGSPTGGDKGDGTINAEELYENGLRVFAQRGNATDGLEHTPKDHGTVSTGTVTIDPLDGIHHKLVCNGAITISPASTTYHGSVMLHITNGASAGDKTMTGFTFQDTGDAFTNTNGHKFKVIMYFFGSDGCDYLVKKRQ